jgi:hypothetical protein
MKNASAGRYLATLLIGIVTLFLAAIEAVATEPVATQYWQGHLEYRGDRTPVALRLLPTKGQPRAWLDLPEMIMAREPVPVTETDTGLAIELPFGIGPMDIDPDEPVTRSGRAIGENQMTLELSQADAPGIDVVSFGFRAGAATLEGELLLPPGEGPHPAVVLLHGAAHTGRKNSEYRSWADLLVSQGLAVLSYDKRGPGDQAGRHPADLRQLADDGAQAVRALRRREDIDSSRVGFKGSSQVAWVALKIDADLGDLSFLILTAATAGTPG